MESEFIVLIFQIKSVLAEFYVPNNIHRLTLVRMSTRGIFESSYREGTQTIHVVLPGASSFNTIISYILTVLVLAWVTVLPTSNEISS